MSSTTGDARQRPWGLPIIAPILCCFSFCSRHRVRLHWPGHRQLADAAQAALRRRQRARRGCPAPGPHRPGLGPVHGEDAGCRPGGTVQASWQCCGGVGPWACSPPGLLWLASPILRRPSRACRPKQKALCVCFLPRRACLPTRATRLCLAWSALWTRWVLAGLAEAGIGSEGDLRCCNVCICGVVLRLGGVGEGGAAFGGVLGEQLRGRAPLLGLLPLLSCSPG